MINRNGVHLPDTTYGGNPIDWNCSSDSDDSLQRLKAENAKLRERIGELEKLTDNERYIPQEWYAQLKAENAKLRKLVRDLHKALFTLDIDYCQACPRDDTNGPCTKFIVCGSDKCSIEEDMHELGVEVEL